MEQNSKKPTVLIAALIGLGGVICVFLPMGAFIMPGLFAYVLLAGGTAPYLISCMVCLAGVLFIGGGDIATFLLMSVLSFCMANMLKKNRSYFDTALLCAAIAAALNYLSVNLVDILAGNEHFYTLQTMAGEAVNEVNASMRQVAAGLVPAYTEGFNEAFKTMDAFIKLLPTIMPTVLCVIGALTGLFSMIICAYTCKRSNAAVKGMRKFSFWQLPDSFAVGSLLMAACVFAIYFLNLSFFNTVFFAIAVIAGVPYMVQGVSFIWFMLHLQKKKNSLFSALFIVLLFYNLLFNMIVCAVFMAFTGLLEQFLHIRRRVLHAGNY